MNLLRFCAALGLFGCIWGAGCQGDKEPATGGPQGEVLDFRLDTLRRERFYLNQHRGQVVVLAFWATWCTPCKAELIELKAIAENPLYKDVVVAAVCTDPDNIGEVRLIIETLGINYPVLLDKDAKLFGELKMSAVPTTVVIDQVGRVHLTWQGFDAAIMRQISKSIERLLAVDGDI